MTDMNPTYATEDGVTYAIISGKVVASGANLDEVEREVNRIVAADDVCSYCKGSGKQPSGSFCTYCGGTGNMRGDKSPHQTQSATHIVTPNGVKGQILSRTAGLWSDEVTVRFDNGQIHSVAVTDKLEFATEQHKTASAKPIDRLYSEINKTANGSGRKTLANRIITLARVKDEAHMLIASGISYEDTRDLHEIVLLADHEVSELKEAIDHIDTAEGEAYTPFKPEQQVLEGENVGHNNDGTWLDVTLNDMIAESEGTDFDALLDDGPTLMVSEQDDGMVADGGAIRELALSHVRNKTAGLGDQELAAKYENAFVARAEEARRVELAHRKATTKKETATKKSTVDDAPVESLFL